MELLTNIKLLFTGMLKYFNFKSISSITLTIMAYLVGANHFEMLYALIVLVVIDFVTGVAASRYMGHTISSKTSFRSASKFVVYMLFVAAAHLAENIIPGETYFEVVVASFLALTEFISIIENIGNMDFAIPKKLLTKLHEYRDEQ